MSALESDKRSSENEMSIERSSDPVSTEVKPGADSHAVNQSALKEFSDDVYIGKLLNFTILIVFNKKKC